MHEMSLLSVYFLYLTVAFIVLLYSHLMCFWSADDKLNETITHSLTIESEDSVGIVCSRTKTMEFVFI
jgi:hypothetical protein